MKIIESETENHLPYVIVIAIDEADAEIFAQKEAANYDSYFSGMKAQSAKDVSEFYEDEIPEGYLAFNVKFD